MSVSTSAIRPAEGLSSQTGYSRKRNAADDMSSPAKKRKAVAFDSDVEVFNLDEASDNDPALIREETKRAIIRHLAGDSEAYNKLCDIFKTDPRRENAPSGRRIKIHLQAVLANISNLTKQCSKLVNAILNSEWAGKDQGHVTLFFQFLGNLVAVNSSFLPSVTQMLVALLSTTKPKRLPGFKRVNPSAIYERAHNAIQHLLNVSPTAASSLAASIIRQLRFDAETAQEDVVLAKNALKIAGYCEPLRSMILAHITTEVVKVDGFIQGELDDSEDLSVEDIIEDLASSQTYVPPSCQSLFEEGSPPHSVESDSDDDSDLDEELDEETKRQRRVKANIAKVDGILDLLFQYYDDCFSKSKSQDNAIELLFSHFHTIIIPTHRSRHTQFLIFHFVQRSDALIDRFATSCVSTIFDIKQPPIVRQITAAFLASFVSRGAQVSARVAQDCFTLLCGLLTDLQKEYTLSCRGPDYRRYSAFYATAQALFYIFCFRWRDLMVQTRVDDDDENGDQTIEYTLPSYFRETLSDAIFSPLNPLKICSEGIVHEFAKINAKTQTMFLWSKIEMNKRVRLVASKRSLADLPSGLNQPDRDTALTDNVLTDDYFPFDPYHLPQSKRWVSNDYRVWQGIDEDDPDQSESDENPLEEEEDGVSLDSMDEDEDIGVGERHDEEIIEDPDHENEYDSGSDDDE
ncbi:MAG: hypothetical protein Q9227_005171 [Pyrenula ochraceoflavens]